ncbi:MAG: CCA tRNA nucleotidyltransferase [Candidatus Cloacimonetes bacterium]|nr:CCA tRNA nucleotidyltransferase [Candidatus Cloacimonadota bacterium]
MKQLLQLLAKTVCGTVFDGKTYIVGGFVRDTVMKKSSQDIDLVVEMPEGGIKLAIFLHQKMKTCKPVVYPKFGTAMVHLWGHNIEMVMTRKESYRQFSRKPDVLFGTLREDIYRRDFTINSLLMNIVNHKIIDTTGLAYQDIADKIIRSTSNPDIIFVEDPLRMLRAIRFCVQLGFTIEPTTKQGIVRHARQLTNISQERVRDEFNKMLLSPNPVLALQMLREFHLLDCFIPELSLRKNHPDDSGIDVWQHTMQVVQRVPHTPVMVLAALLRDTDKKTVSDTDYPEKSAKIAARILKRMTYSNKDQAIITTLIRYQHCLREAGADGLKLSDKEIRRLIVELEELLEPLLLLIDANNNAEGNGNNQQVAGIQKRVKILREEITELPIDGASLMEHFQIESGTEVGRFLAEAKELWLENPAITRSQLLVLLSLKKIKTEPVPE